MTAVAEPHIDDGLITRRLRPGDETERVTAGRLKSDDWIVIPWLGWAWQLGRADVEGRKVTLQARPSAKNPHIEHVTFTAWTTTWFVRLVIDRTIDMRPDLKDQR